ncbi:MAG: cupin domain-containing protein [Kiloniellales bacterium]
MRADKAPVQQPIVLAANEGRSYELGNMRAVFKADDEDTGESYSISEWRLKPNTAGPGAHSHETNDDIFYILDGTASVLVGHEWIEAPTGSFVCVPAGVVHGFANRTDKKMGLLNIYVPGGFEKDMPAIVKWFAENR